MNIFKQCIYLKCVLLTAFSPQIAQQMHILITVEAALASHAVKWHYCIIHRENLMIIVSAGSGSKNTGASGVTCNYLDI